MEDKEYEVITLLSSDEDSNSQVDICKNSSKSLKSTARKSMYNARVIGAPIMKKENELSFLNYSTVRTQENNENQVEVNSMKSCIESNLFSKNTSARKSVKNPLVSNLKDSLNSRSSKTTATVSNGKQLPNLVGPNIKLPELTITPLQVSSSSKATATKPNDSVHKNSVVGIKQTAAYKSNPDIERKLNCKSAQSPSRYDLRNTSLVNNEVSRQVPFSCKKSLTTAGSCAAKTIKAMSVPNSLTVKPVSVHTKVSESFKINHLKFNIPTKKFETPPTTSKIYLQSTRSTAPKSFRDQANVRNTDFDKMVAKEKDPSWLLNKDSRSSKSHFSRGDKIKNSPNVEKTFVSHQPHNSYCGIPKSSVALNADSSASDIVITKIIRGDVSKPSSNRKKQRPNNISIQKTVLQVPFHKENFNGPNHEVYSASSNVLVKSNKMFIKEMPLSNKCSSIVNDFKFSDKIRNNNLSANQTLNNSSVELSSDKIIGAPTSTLSNKAFTIVPLFSAPTSSYEKKEMLSTPLKYKESFENLGTQNTNKSETTMEKRKDNIEQAVQKVLDKRNIERTVKKSIDDNIVKQSTLYNKAIEPLTNSHDSNSHLGRGIVKSVPLIPETQLNLAQPDNVGKKEQVSFDNVSRKPAEKERSSNESEHLTPISVLNSENREKAHNNNVTSLKSNSPKDCLPVSSTELVVQVNRERIASLKRSLQDTVPQYSSPPNSQEIFQATVVDASDSSNNFWERKSENSVAVSKIVGLESEVNNEGNSSSSAFSLTPVDTNCSPLKAFSSVDECNKLTVSCLPWKPLQAIELDDPDCKKHYKQVTSPKLSLKRKSINSTDTISNCEKKLKLESPLELSAPIPLPYQPLKIAAAVDTVLEGPKPDEPIPLPYHTLDAVPPTATLPHQQRDTSFPWSSFDDNTTKYKKLLEFSKSCMRAATEKEKRQICKNMLKPLNRVDPSFVNKVDFSNFMEVTVSKIQETPEDIFVHLQDLKTELDAYKSFDLDTSSRKRCLSISSDQSESMKSIISLKEKKHVVVLEPRAFSLAFKSALNSESDSSQMAANENVVNKIHSESAKTSALKDQLMSALKLVTSNISADDENKITNRPTKLQFSDIPSTSKQADIVENLYFSMPESSNVSALQKENSLQSNPLSTECANKAKETSMNSKPKKTKNMKADDVEKKLDVQVRKLEVLLGQLDKKIRKCQAKELTLDDLNADDSSYLMEDRYKKKFAKAWRTLCKYKKRSSLVGLEIERRFNYAGTRYNAINLAVEKLINKRKPAEKFPDYGEVLNLIKKVNEDSHLGMNTFQEEKTARETFTDIGQQLKSRRERDVERDFGCYLTDTAQDDPAEHDEKLRNTLSSNRVTGEKNINEVLDKYVNLQIDQSNNGDGAAEESEDSADEENQAEMEDLPDTDPATPSTEGQEEDADQPPTVPNSPITHLVEVENSSSDASTDPSSSGTHPPPNKTTHGATDSVPSNVETKQNNIFSNPVFISDEIEIVEDSESNSPDLPPLVNLIS